MVVVVSSTVVVVEVSSGSGSISGSISGMVEVV